MIEQEIKLSLSAKVYQELLIHLSASCGAATLLQQENCFFDSSDGALQQQRAALRLRRQNQTLILTFKQRRQGSGLIHRQLEEEQNCNLACWPLLAAGQLAINQVLPLPAACRALIGQRDLYYFVSFSNSRWQFRDEPHLLCLDHSRFNQHHDEYELEIESPAIEAAADKWLPLLRRWGCQELPQSRSKLERCIACAATDDSPELQHAMCQA